MPRTFMSFLHIAQHRNVPFLRLNEWFWTGNDDSHADRKRMYDSQHLLTNRREQEPEVDALSLFQAPRALATVGNGLSRL